MQGRVLRRERSVRLSGDCRHGGQCVDDSERVRRRGGPIGYLHWEWQPQPRWRPTVGSPDFAPGPPPLAREAGRELPGGCETQGCLDCLCVRLFDRQMAACRSPDGAGDLAPGLRCSTPQGGELAQQARLPGRPAGGDQRTSGAQHVHGEGPGPDIAMQWTRLLQGLGPGQRLLEASLLRLRPRLDWPRVQTEAEVAGEGFLHLPLRRHFRPRLLLPWPHGLGHCQVPLPRRPRLLVALRCGPHRVRADLCARLPPCQGPAALGLCTHHPGPLPPGRLHGIACLVHSLQEDEARGLHEAARERGVPSQPRSPGTHGATLHARCGEGDLQRSTRTQ
mmetsp:Transcript_26204/g.57636  ORF Transcript_26204/g.57636 Transcript_26204/m.57636 type:complete len:335 (-) Transcript_26204:368-1372(-)